MITQNILKDFENASLVLLLLTLRIQDLFELWSSNTFSICIRKRDTHRFLARFLSQFKVKGTPRYIVNKTLLLFCHLSQTILTGMD